MVRKTIRLLLLFLALVALRKILFEPPHWAPDVLGALPRGEVLNRGSHEVVERLAEKRPDLTNYDEVSDPRIQSVFREGTAFQKSGPRAGQTWAAVGRLGFALESMPVVIVPAGGTVEYRVTLPEGADFETHVAGWFSREGTPRPLRFTVDVVSEHQVTRVVDRTAPPAQPPGTTLLHRAAATLERWTLRGARPKRWLLKQVEADLSEWSGRSVALRLRVEDEAGAPSAGVGLWGAPTILGAPEGAKPNLLFLVIDGLSPYFTDCLEDRAWTDTPVIADLCRKGEVVRRMYTAANGTRASIAALAHSSRASDLLLPIYDREIPERVRLLRAWGPPSLFERLAGRGYRTAGIHDNIFAIETHEAGYDLGIEESYVVHGTMQDTPNIVRLASNWLQNHRGVHFALYVHVDVTHDLFKVPPLRDMAATLVHAPAAVPKAFRYASGAHYADRVTGWFRDLLRTEGLDGRTVFIVLSDHGNVFSRDKPRAYYSKRNGRWQWSRPYGRHGGTAYEDDLRVLWVANGPGVRPGVKEFGWLPDEAARWAEAVFEGVEDASKDSIGACRPVDMQMGEAWVCPDGLKYLRFLKGVRVRGDGPERPAEDEVWRVGSGYEEHVLSGPELAEARRHGPPPENPPPRGWVLRIPPDSSIQGEATTQGRAQRFEGDAARRAPPAVASDEGLGCRFREVGADRVSFEGRTQGDWCEFYFELPGPALRLDLRDGGRSVAAVSLGPLGIKATGPGFQLDVSKAPLLRADAGMPSVFLSEYPMLYTTSRRAWAYSDLPTALSRQTPEVVQIMKDWGYLK
ncbi:MAG: sulfatase-like hydrolase/transferase [Nitrospirae bacterium]|nr:sulfatase-like hydrolase/transferase [Nitrospirota bacterium]